MADTAGIGPSCMVYNKERKNDDNCVTCFFWGCSWKDEEWKGDEKKTKKEIVG